MPQGPQRLRDRFMIGRSDGIAEAEKIILDAGGFINKGMIDLPLTLNDDVRDAVQYLVEEWDYGIEE